MTSPAAAHDTPANARHRPLAFGDGVLHRKVYLESDPARRLCLFGVVLEASDQGVTVGWCDGGMDTYRGPRVRWCLHRMNPHQRVEELHPGAADPSSEYFRAGAGESLGPEPAEGTS